MLTLTYTGSCEEFDVDSFLLENADAMRKAAIDAIEESNELGLDEAHAVEILVDDATVDFTLSKWEWKTFLAESITPLLENEDYETLVKVRELMRIINF